MIRRVLVADRGAAARRVLATCRLAGIEAVAVYSDADAHAPHVAEADWAVHLPGNAPSATYQRIDRLLAAARRTGADAVHPGWGQLAADPDFAAAVADSGRCWLGPPAKVLAVLRDQSTTAARLAEVGVPLLARPPGRPAPHERWRGTVRRLDVPVVVDAHGTAVALGEYDATLRRGPRPLLAESPSPAAPAPLREQAARIARDAAAALGCLGVTTVEMLVSADGGCRVLAITPHLPPMHSVVECATGLDLVRLQLLTAEQSPLPLRGTPALRGHTVTVALLTEDPAGAWQPTSGRLHRFALPGVTGGFRPLPGPGLRVDAGLGSGGEVSTWYGPELATVTAWAPTREETTRRLADALAGAQLHGLATNRDLLVRMLRHPDLRAGTVDPGWVDRHPELLAPLLSSVDAGRLCCLAAALAAAAARRAGAAALGSLASGWRNAPTSTQAAVYSSQMGTIELGYRLDRTGELRCWWVRGVDPDELDLAGLGQPGSRPDDRPPVALISATAERVVLDVAGVRSTYRVARVGDISYVDSAEGSVQLHELPRYPVPVALEEGLA